LKVYVGSKDVTFKVTAYREVASIGIKTQPEFKQQVLFDDPRLIGSEPTNKAHWLNKLEGGIITVHYVGIDATKERKMVEAYNINAYNGGDAHGFIITPTADFTGSSGAIGISYYNCKQYYEVPVFDALIELTAYGDPIAVPKLIHVSDTEKDDEDSFFGKHIKVRATYESGRGGTKVYRTDTWIQTQKKDGKKDEQSEKSEYVPSGWDNQSSTGELSLPANFDALLVKATTESNKVPPKTTDITVTFKTPKGATKGLTSKVAITAINYK